MRNEKGKEGSVREGLREALYATRWARLLVGAVFLRLALDKILTPKLVLLLKHL